MSRASPRGNFFRADSSRALEDIYAQIDKLEKSTVQVDKYRQYRDLFRWFAGRGLVLPHRADGALADALAPAAMTSRV